MALYMTMIPLDAGAQISGKAVCFELARAWPKLKPVADQEDGGTFGIRADSCEIIGGVMPAPIPWSDLESVCETSMLFPDAVQKLRNHTTHLVLTVSDPEKPLDGIRLLTQATAAVLRSCPQAPGVYWTHAGHVIDRENFLKFSDGLKADFLPLILWVNCRVGNHESGGSSGFTCGLDSLGHREFEAQNSPETGVELRKRLHSLAEYVVENGPVIADQDTIGESASEKIRIIYADGSFNQPKQVMRLEYVADSETSEEGGSAPRKKRIRITAYGYLHIVLTLAVTIGVGYLLHGLASYLISSAVIRHVLLTIPILIFGLLFLLISDKFLQKKFGLEAFHEVDA